MLASSSPASMLNQNPTSLGTPYDSLRSENALVPTIAAGSSGELTRLLRSREIAAMGKGSGCNDAT